MDVNPLSSLSTAGKASNDRVAIAEDFDQFLGLLITQLQSQDPSDPLDTNQFTQQLVQFTEVEQTVKMNENIEQLISLSAASAITNVVGYIGKEVTAAGASAELKSGLAQWPFNLAASSNDVSIKITNSSGATVFEENVAAGAGSHVFSWDGTTSTGGVAPEGLYNISITALDGSGSRIEASTATTGIVDGVDMSGSDILLNVGSQKIRLDEVTAIKTP